MFSYFIDMDSVDLDYINENPTKTDIRGSSNITVKELLDRIKDYDFGHFLRHHSYYYYQVGTQKH